VAEPSDLLAQAQKFFASATGDLDYRVVIERAYYGAYHAARQFEELLPHRSPAVHQSSHESLLQALERPNRQLDYTLSVICKDVGAQLRMLKPLRELASYELHEAIRVDQAEEAIRAATDIINECAKGFRKIKSS
jgi:uncharacterized protein (UPF0332 family)